MNTSARTDTSPAPSFTAALGEQLVVAHGRLRRRRQRRRTGLAVAVVALVALFAAASLSVFDPQPAAAEPVRVERRADGSVLIAIDRDGALPADLHTALLRANLDNTTKELTTGPSRVGTILSVAFDQPVRPFGLEETLGRELVLPAGYTGNIALGFGVAAPPGTLYDTPTDAFAREEPLAGFSKPTDAAAVVDAAVKKKLRVTIIESDGVQRAVASGKQVAPGATILKAFMTSATELGIRLDG